MAKAKAKAKTATRTRKPTVKPPTRVDATSEAIEALFAELERDPTNEGATLVLADALDEAGDVRAELAHVQIALAKASKAERAGKQQREAALLQTLCHRLLGEELGSSPGVRLDVRLGFVRGLELVDLTTDDIEAALTAALPSSDARLLESLHIATDEDGVMELGDVFRRLAGNIAIPPSLRRLKLGHSFERFPDDRTIEQTATDDEGEPLDPPPEDLRTVLTMFPRLRELELDLGAVPVQLAPLATKNLETLTWITPRITAGELAPLERSLLPNLRRFELWIGATYGESELEDEDDEDEREGDIGIVDVLHPRRLVALLAMLERCTELRELAFGHCTQLGELLDVLRSRRALVDRLEILELSHLEIDDIGDIIDFMRAVPTIKLVLDNVHATDQTQSQLQRRLGSRLTVDWARDPLRFRYITGVE